MSNHAVTRQQIDAFNAAVEGRSPEQLLCSFVELLKNAGPASESMKIGIPFNPLQPNERIDMEVSDLIHGDRRTLAIYGIGLQGRGFKKHTFLGPLECLLRISRGIYDVRMKQVDPHVGKSYRIAMRKELGKQHKKRLGWLKALIEIEDVVTSKCKAELAFSRRKLMEVDRKELRDRLISLEQASSLLQGVLCQLEPIPKVAEFSSTYVVQLFTDMKNPNVQL